MKLFKNCLSLSLLFSVMLLLHACGSGTNSGEGIQLQLNFKPGDKYLYTTDMQQEISYQGMANLKQDVLMGMLYEMKEAEGENKKLSISYQQIKMNTTSPMGSITYNSEFDTTMDQSVLAIMGRIIGKSFDVLIAPDGTIVSVHGLDSIVTALTQGNGDLQVDIKNQFSDSSIKMMMASSFDMYPGKTVKPGDSWTKKSSMNFSGFTITIESTYTLQSVNGDIATLKAHSTMTLPSKKTEDQGIPLEMELNGTQNATMELSVSSGHIISAKTDQDIKGKIKAGGQEMPMDIKGTIKVTGEKQ